MKKMMFNDEQGLTDAVKAKLKNQTRRAVSNRLWEKWTDYDDFCSSVAVGDIPTTREFYDEKAFFLAHSPYKVGEVVAIAQSYASIVDELEDPKNFCCMEHWESAGPKRAHYAGFLYHPGMTNKMFVSAKEMPHHIRITKVRVEHLQDISDEDCLAEGVVKEVKRIPTETEQYVTQYYPSQVLKEAAERVGWGRVYDSPKLAYEVLIGYISGKSVWEKNPYVFVYDFEIVD